MTKRWLEADSKHSKPVTGRSGTATLCTSSLTGAEIARSSSPVDGTAVALGAVLPQTQLDFAQPFWRGAGQPGTAAPRARLRSGLVVAELASALVLLMGAGLLARSLLQLLAVDLGFRPDKVVGVRMGRLSKSWFLQGHARSEFYDAVRERLAALPGVASVALTLGRNLRRTVLSGC